MLGAEYRTVHTAHDSGSPCPPIPRYLPSQMHALQTLPISVPNLLSPLVFFVLPQRKKKPPTQLALLLALVAGRGTGWEQDAPRPHPPTLHARGVCCGGRVPWLVMHCCVDCVRCPMLPCHAVPYTCRFAIAAVYRTVELPDFVVAR